MVRTRDPDAPRRERERARAGRRERRVLLTPAAAEKAERLAGGPGRQAFSDLVNILLLAAEENAPGER